MKFKLSHLFKIIFLGGFLFSSSFQSYAQQMEYTPYEELPTIEKILKPTYSENLPDWAKMLYQYPVNFNEINKGYDEYMRANPDTKNALTRYFRLWKKNLAEFADADGNINIEEVNAMYKANASGEPLRSKSKNVKSAGDVSDWTFWGPKNTYWLNESGDASAPDPAPWQANVYSIDVVDDFPDVIYAGTETGYVSKSINKGETWSLMNLNYVFGGGINAIAVNPLQPDSVFVAGGNAIHKSYNGGVSWAKMNTGFQANRLRFDYTNTKKLVASADKGVFITNNRGLKWDRKSSRSAWDIEFKPNSPDTIYALTQNDANFFEIIQSNNGGASFAKMAAFPSDIRQESGGLLAVTPANPNVLWAILLSRNAADEQLPYIYKGTLSEGEWTWKLMYTGKSGLSHATHLTSGQGYFDLVLEVSPLNENIIYAGTTTLFKSVNGGVRFNAVGGYQGSFAIHPDIQDMRILSNGETWVSTDGGMNYSSDGFVLKSKWKALNEGLIGSDMWGFDQGWNEDIIVGGRYHNGNTAMADFYGDKSLRMGGGESPTGWILKGKSRHAVFDDLGNGWILPKTAEGKPEGRFTFSKHPNMDQYGSYRTEVLTHPNYSGTLFVGSGNDMWKSTDYGVNFDLQHTFPGKIRFVGISTSSPEVMYADIIDNGFYRTDNGGETWTKTKGSSAPSWTGEMTFAISPYDSDVIYASKQIGVWGNFNSEMYRSADGGASWTKWSQLNVSIKAIAIQPTSDGKDLVYALSSSVGGSKATAFFKKDGDSDWTKFDTNYPAFTRVQAAAIFFRDSKLRIGGNGGVWETPLAEPEFTPILVPWVDRKLQKSTSDTIQLDDHSWLNHTGATWDWEITPAPAYISDPKIRNPKIVAGDFGKYTVTMKVTKNGVEYSKLMPDFFEVISAPNISCDEKATLPHDYFKLIYADSYEVASGDKPENAFDGNTSTIWHTSWTNPKPFPHEIQIDLGREYNVSQFTYTGRQGGGTNGMVKNYSLYISSDKVNWGSPVKTGVFINTAEPQTVSFDEKQGKYARFVATSEVNNYNYTSAAEISFFGCSTYQTGLSKIENTTELKAFPVPSNSQITINLPFNNGFNSYDYTVHSSTGQQITSGTVGGTTTKLSIDLMDYKAGYYFVNLVDLGGSNYRVKFIKK